MITGLNTNAQPVLSAYLRTEIGNTAERLINIPSKT
jgi:hypothetical protein